LVVYWLICFVIFWVLDIFSYRNKSGVLVISAIGALGVWKVFLYGITAESLQNIFITIVRNTPQNIVLYALVFGLSRILLGAFGRRRAGGALHKMAATK